MDYMKLLFFLYLLGVGIEVVVLSFSIFIEYISYKLDATLYSNWAKIGLYRDYETGELQLKKKNYLWYVATTYCLGFWLSWVGVFISSKELIVSIFNKLQNIVDNRPERIKELSFPLKSISTLEKEAVWARIYAIAILAGVVVDIPEKTLYEELSLIYARIEDFDLEKAVRYLMQLNLKEFEFLKNEYGIVFRNILCSKESYKIKTEKFKENDMDWFLRQLKNKESHISQLKDKSENKAA